MLVPIVATAALTVPVLAGLGDAPLATVYRDFDLRGISRTITSEECVTFEVPLKYRVRSIQVASDVTCGFFYDSDCEASIYYVDGTDIYIDPSPKADSIKCVMQS